MANKHPFEAFPESLWRASSSAARYVLEHYADANDLSRIPSAISLGTAIEHLIMACVASFDVTLLADRTSVPSALALSRHNRDGKLDLHALKTITWGSGLALLELSDSKVFAIRKDAAFVMETRNAAAHMAMTDDADLAEGAVRLARIVGVLHTFLPKLDEKDYWGAALLPVIDELRNIRASAIERSYLAKTTVAKARFDALFAGIRPAQTESMLSAMENRPPRPTVLDANGGTWERHKCPACDRSAYLHYVLDDWDDYESQMDYDGDEVVTVSVEWTPVDFQCPVCDLTLDTDEVTEIQGVNSFVHEERKPLEGFDLEQYRNDMEIEEALVRWGRER